MWSLHLDHLQIDCSSESPRYGNNLHLDEDQIDVIRSILGELQPINRQFSQIFPLPILRQSRHVCTQCNYNRVCHSYHKKCVKCQVPDDAIPRLEWICRGGRWEWLQNTNNWN
jgi:hypothetical protein